MTKENLTLANDLLSDIKEKTAERDAIYNAINEPDRISVSITIGAKKADGYYNKLFFLEPNIVIDSLKVYLKQVSS